MGTIPGACYYKLETRWPNSLFWKQEIFKADVQVAGRYAFATETYTYTLVVAKDKSEVKRKGVATSV